MVVDVHVHTFPDNLAIRALQKLVDKADNRITTVGDGNGRWTLKADARSSG